MGRGSREAEAEVKQVSALNFVCHMCCRLCRWKAGLKSHLRAHGRGLGVPDDSPSNCGEGGDEHSDGCRLLRRSNGHVCMYIVIHRQAVSMYQNFSVGLDTRDSQSWDRNFYASRKFDYTAKNFKRISITFVLFT